MSASRRSVIAVLSAVGFVLVGAWGVVNLFEGDWFIGGAMLGSALIGLWSLLVRTLQERSRRPRGPFPPTNKAADKTPRLGWRAAEFRSHTTRQRSSL